MRHYRPWCPLHQLSPTALEIPIRAPGQTVKHAHSHPNGEEVIYIISGSGKVMVDGHVEEVKAGCAVLFPQGKVHMLSNTGADFPGMMQPLL